MSIVTDEPRIALDEVIADVAYLFSRVAMDRSFTRRAIEIVQWRLAKVRAALEACCAGETNSVNVPDEVNGSAAPRYMTKNTADAWAVGWNACRYAMLKSQGRENETY